MKYTRTVLKNGLRVLTIPLPTFESVTVLLMVGAGSRYENKKNNGISHFLEHMAFKGTKKRPSALEIASIVDGMGGECNAFTGKETTGYHIKALKNHLDTCLDVLSDIIQNSLFDKAEIQKERGVIIGEIDLYEDTPMRKIGDIYESLLYGDTPMGWDIAGEKDIILSIQRNDFLSYLKSLYSASNMTVVVAGGIDEKKTITMVKKYFGSIKKFETKKYPPVIENQTQPQVMLKKKDTTQAHIALGVRTVSLDHKDRYPLSVLAAILGGGMSSRLFSEVREKRGLGYYVRTRGEYYHDCGSLTTYTGVDQKRVDEAIEVILHEYSRLGQGKEKVSAQELKKSKEFVKGFVLNLEDSENIASFYGAQELLEQKLDNPDDELKKIDAVSQSDIQRVAAKYLVKDKLNLAVIGNFKDEERFQKILKS